VHDAFDRCYRAVASKDARFGATRQLWTALDHAVNQRPPKEAA
jgi:hypothetical protein